MYAEKKGLEVSVCSLGGLSLLDFPISENILDDCALGCYDRAGEWNPDRFLEARLKKITPLAEVGDQKHGCGQSHVVHG